MCYKNLSHIFDSSSGSGDYEEEEPEETLPDTTPTGVTATTNEPNWEQNGGCIARRFANYCITTDRADCKNMRFPRWNRVGFNSFILISFLYLFRF